MTSPATARPTPAAGSFSIIPGIAVSEDEVPRTTKSSVRSRRSKSNRRIPANRQIVPNPAKMKTAIMAQAVPTKSASTYNVASPNFATVNAMAPKAPIGANATTTCTTLQTSPALAQEQQADAAKQRQHEHLEHIAAGKGSHKAVGDHVLDIGRDRPDLRLRKAGGCLRLLRGRVCDAGARLHPPDHHEAEQQAKGGDSLKVDQGLEAYAPHRPHVAYLRDACDHHQEDQGRDGHLDQGNEGIPKRFQFGRLGGKHSSCHSPQDRAGGYQNVQLAPERPLASADGKL